MELLEYSDIWCLPVTRASDGKIIHPPAYAAYRNDPGKKALAQFFEIDNHYNGIAAIPGINGLCCLDFDIKNTTEKDIYDKWASAVDPRVLAKCFIESSKSGGKHVFFFCHGFDHERQLAFSVEGKIAIEIFCVNEFIVYTHPTPGYTPDHLSLSETGIIDATDAAGFIEAAEKLNRLEGKEKTIKGKGSLRLTYPDKYENLFHRFDFQVDLSILLDWFKGREKWKVKYDPRSEAYILTHPGSTASRSGVFFEKSKRFICHSTSQSLFPSWGNHSKTTPVAYNITPSGFVYYCVGESFDDAAKVISRMIPPAVSFSDRRWLLKYVTKDYLKQTIHKFGARKLTGTDSYTIKVSSHYLVYLMALFEPQYTWTTTGQADQEFDDQTCKEIVSQGRIDYLRTPIILNEHNYPLAWD